MPDMGAFLLATQATAAPGELLNLSLNASAVLPEASFGQYGGGVEREIQQLTRGSRGLGGEKESTHVGHGSLEPLRWGDCSGA